jgi:superfamily II DNA or RNA helicase
MARVVEVVLTNRKANLVCDDPSLSQELNDFLKYRKPGWEYTPGGKVYTQWRADVLAGRKKEDEPEGWDGYLHLIQGNRVGAGVILALREKMEKELNCTFEIEDERKLPKFSDGIEDWELEKKARQYQLDCLGEMLINSYTGGLILNATGTGKTFSTGLYLKRLKGPALFLVDELTLLKQAIGELQSVLGEDIGEIGNQVFRPRRVTVATIQTIHKHRFDQSYVPWTRTLQAIIIDEVHLALNRRNFQTIAAIKPPVIFGLTATLELKKKAVAYRAYDLCGPVVFEYPLEQGVREGFLSKGVAVSVQVEQDIKPEAIRGNPRWAWVRAKYKAQYQELYRDVIVEGKKRNKVILDLIKTAYNEGKHIVVLLNRVQHLKDLSKRLDGIKHQLVFGDIHVSDRVLAQKRMEESKLRVILTNVVFKKGINLRRLDVIVDGAGMKSKNDAVQKYGRGVRLCDGKSGLIYFDISDRGNKFENAAKSRLSALKKVGVPVFKIDSTVGAERILVLAEKKLRSICERDLEKDS